MIGIPHKYYVGCAEFSSVISRRIGVNNSPMYSIIITIIFFLSIIVTS